MSDRIRDIFSEPHSYRRFLPHIQPINAYYSVTGRLVDSLPRSFIMKLKMEREKFIQEIKRISDKYERHRILNDYDRAYFIKYDEALHKINSGPVWLSDERIAQVVYNAMHYRDSEVYDLIASTIMPNHIHLVFWLGENHVSKLLKNKKNKHEPQYIVSNLMESLKKYTATVSNNILGRKGRFWYRESYDHVIRNRIELRRAVRYVLNNPVKAGFAEKPEEWKWNYCREDFRL